MPALAEIGVQAATGVGPVSAGVSQVRARKLLLEVGACGVHDAVAVGPVTRVKQVMLPPGVQDATGSDCSVAPL